MAKAYQYDAAGYFVGETDDYGGPLPNNSTREAPEVQAGFIPKWAANAWTQVENYKGREGYVDGEPFTVKEYGPLPAGWSDTPPPPTLEEVKQAKLAEINAAFAQAEAEGHVASSLGFEIDATDRANRDTEGLITMMESTGTAATYFCDYDNVMREVTLGNIKTMRLEIIAYGQQLYAKKWALRSAVETAATVEEVQAVNW